MILLSPNELCFSIFSLKNPQASIVSKMPNIISECYFEIYNKQQFDIKFLKKLLDEKNSIDSALTSLNFSFDYSFDLVQTLAVVNFMEIEQKYAAAYITLFIYNQCIRKNNFQNDLLPYIFQCIIKYTKIINNEDDTINPSENILLSIRPLFLSAFYNLYNTYIISDKIQFFDQIRSYVYEFFNNNPDLPEYSYYMLIEASRKIVDQKCTTITSHEIEFFTFVDICARERDSSFPNEVLEACIESLTIRLNGLDLFALTFFSHFTDKISPKFSLTYFEVFPLSIFQFISNKSPYNNFTFFDLPPVDNLKIKVSSEFTYGFNKAFHFKEKIDFETSLVFPEFIPTSKFIDPEVLNRISLIVKAAEPLPELIITLIDIFTNVLSEMAISKYTMDMLSIFIEIINSFPTFYNTNPVCKMLIKSSIFDARVNAFSQSEDYNYISSLRSAAFEYFYKAGMLANFVELNIKRPYILAEHLHRIFQSNVILNIEQKIHLVRAIINAELTYQSLSYSDKGVQIARASIFVLMSRLLADPEFSIEFFKEDWFTAIFILSFLFENSLRSFVLSCIRTNIISDESKNPRVVNTLSNSIKIATESFPSKSALEVVSDILSMLNDIANSKPSICDLLSSLREPISTALAVLSMKINESSDLNQETTIIEIAQEILNQTISFFTATSTYERTTAASISAFESAALSFHGENLPSSLFGKIIQLISGSVTPSLLPNFIIREPKFIPFFMKLYRFSSKFIEILQFIKSLCNFARENCAACHKGKADLYLLNVLLSLKTVFQNPNEKSPSNTNQVIEECLSLLTIIESVASSVSFVHHCIELLTPINSKYISKLQPQFIKTISQMITKTVHNPSASFPLLSTGAQFEITFDSSLLQPEKGGFVFSFWIYLDNPTSQYMPRLIEFSDSSSQKILIYLNMARIIFEAHKKKTKSTGICDKPFPTSAWTFVTIHIYTNLGKDDKTIICLNGKVSYDLSYPHLDFTHRTIKAIIGGTLPNTIDSEQPVLLATFGILQMIEEADLNALYELGPRINECPAQTIIIIKTINENNELKLDKLTRDDNANIQLTLNNVHKIKQNPNFTDILLSSVKIDNLIPLFAQLDLNYIDEMPYSDCSELALQLFGSLLTSSIIAQQSLYESKGFNCIGHILASTDSSHITYKLYLRFFGLFQACSFAPLHEQMLESILLNFNILMKANPKNHLLILKHWSRSLFPATLSNKTATIKFGQLINTLIIYYWDVEPQYIIVPKNKLRESLEKIQNETDKTVDLSQYRKCIVDIAIQVAQYRFDDEDLSILISHIINSRDEKMIDTLLGILQTLVSMNSSPLLHAKESKKNLLLILYLMNFKNENIVSNTIDLMVLLIKNKIVSNITLSELSDITIRHMSTEELSNNLLQRLTILIMNETYELLSLGFFIAANLNEESIINFISTLQPSPHFATHVSWSMWPIVICYKIPNEDIRNNILTFLLECDENQWSNIISMIDYVGQVLSSSRSSFISSDDLKARALTLLCKIVLSKPKSDNKKCIDIVTRFIFFNNKTNTNTFLARLYKASPFYQHEVMIPEKKLPISLSSSQGSLNRVPFLNLKSTLSSNLISDATIGNSSLMPSLSPISSSRTVIRANEIYEIIQKNTFLISHHNFGIRFDEDGNWCDAELAEDCIKVFMKAPHEISSDTDSILIMASFLIRQKPEMFSLIKSLVQIISSNAKTSVYTSYLDYSALKANFQPLLNSSFISNTTTNNAENYNNTSPISLSNSTPISNREDEFHLAANALESLKNYRIPWIIKNEKQFSMNLKNFLSLNWSKSLNIFSLIDDNIVSFASYVVQERFNNLELKQKGDAKIWARLWRSLSFGRAPWNDDFDPNHQALHWKRDFSSCLYTIPFKLKQNWNFDDHKMASMLRDNEIHGQKNEEKNSPKQLNDSKQSSQNNIKNTPRSRKTDNQILTARSLKKQYDCELIKPIKVYSGNLLIYPTLIKFVCKEKTLTILFEDIRDLFLRHRIHKPSAIEVFTTYGKSYFINFKNKDGLKVIHQLSKFSIPRIRNLQLTTLQSYFKTQSLTDLWIGREISNFEYIMHLNLMSGRSFNDLSQYPIFPWVIADFTSDTLSLLDIKTYRDLSKPIGALNSQKFALIKNRANQMNESNNTNYLYSSGHSYPLILIEQFIRVEPYTSLNIDIQHGKFAPPQRIFYSIPKLWNNVLTSINDNRELTPEFYSNPDFLINFEKYDLGKINISEKDNPSYQKIDDVLLPPWASTAFDFVYKMRKALESEYVSRHLNEWIDLIWGCNQRAPNNIFKPEMYENAWSIHSDLIDDVLEASLLNIGQIPPQLFSFPHPTRVRPMKLFSNHQSFNFKTKVKSSLAVFYYSNFDRNNLSILEQTSINSLSLPSNLPISNESKINIIVMLPDSKLNIYSIVHAKKNRAKTHRVSLSDSKSRFAQQFSVLISQKELKKGNIPSSFSSFDQKLLVSFLKPSTLIMSIYGSSEIYLYNIATDQSSKIETPLNETTFIASDYDYFAVACKNAVVNVFKVIDKYPYAKQIASIASYRAKIPCLAISERFNLIVNGTKDGCIIISSLSSCVVENVISLNGGIPLNISISPSWGFIVVYYHIIDAGMVTQYINVYNVNGVLLKKIDIKVGLTSMLTFSSPSSFDYLVLADVDGRLYMTDIYELKITDSFFRCHSKLALIEYNHKEACFVALTVEGTIILISHEFD